MSDAPSSSSTTFAASVGRSNRAFISTSTDRDWFRISLSPRFSYSFRIASSGSLDPIINVRNRRGRSLAFNDDQSTSTRDSLINFRPRRAGIYYLDVGSYGSTTGEYILSVSRASTAVTPSPGSVRPPSQVPQPLPAPPTRQPVQTLPAPIPPQSIQTEPSQGSREWYEWALRNGIGTSRPGQDLTGIYRGPTIFSNPLGVDL